MTANNGWPGKPGVPLNPEKGGWHWVEIIHGISQPRPRLWWSKIDRWELSDGALISSSEFAERWRYLGPVLTPDEATALQARADRNAAGFARVDAEAERDKFLHKQEIAALQKRVAELEAALRNLLPEAINDRYLTQSYAVEQARAALGGKDE